VVRTEGAPRAGRRRRRGSRRSEGDGERAAVPVTLATAIRAFDPLAGEDEARRWLDEAAGVDDTADVLVEEGAALLNRALHAQGVATGDPGIAELSPARAIAVRIGYGTGDEVAESRYSEAREIDPGGGRRRRRREDLRPIEVVAALLGGRQRADACETLIPRARADLDAGRTREAALQLRVGLEALLAELRDALSDPGHSEDMAVLGERRSQAGDAANAALRGELDETAARDVAELIELSERVLRRRRVLRG
jgi:hypothetical protein